MLWIIDSYRDELNGKKFSFYTEWFSALSKLKIKSLQKRNLKKPLK